MTLGSHNLNISMLGAHTLSNDILSGPKTLTGSMQWVNAFGSNVGNGIGFTPNMNYANEDLYLNITIVVVGTQTTGSFVVTLDSYENDGLHFMSLTNTGSGTSGTLFASAGWTVTLNNTSHTISGTLSSVAVGTYVIQVKWGSTGLAPYGTAPGFSFSSGSYLPFTVSFTSLSTTEVPSGSKTACSALSAVSLWTIDATSGWNFPSGATEWTKFIAHRITLNGLIGNPDSQHDYWNSGGAGCPDNIGAFPMTESGTGVSYSNAVAGFSMQAINFITGDTGKLQSVSSSLPDISTDHVSSLVVAKVTTPAATRGLVAFGTTFAQVEILSTGKARVFSGAVSADSTSTETGAVRSFALIQQHAVDTWLVTDLDTTAPASIGTMTGKSVAIGGSGGNTSPTMQLIYDAWWLSSNILSTISAAAVIAALKPS